jgi:hypothetical protein
MLMSPAQKSALLVAFNLFEASDILVTKLQAQHDTTQTSLIDLENQLAAAIVARDRNQAALKTLVDQVL